MTGARFLIITADDFGLHEAVNEAVEQACVHGVLTAASLMMGEEATADAVKRARHLPHLRVGLHVVLADGHALLPPGEVDALTDRAGRFGEQLVLNGLRLFCLPRVRRQLEAEIRAQFRAFARTGLTLDHVNAHKHFHLHPTVLALILEVGREFGLRAVRVPAEPALPGCVREVSSRAAALSLAPWIALMKHRLRRAGVMFNDALLGIADSGRLVERRLLTLVQNLPDGLTEIYLHPATQTGAAITPTMHAYRHSEELAGLMSPRVRDLLARLAIRRGGYGDV